MTDRPSHLSFCTPLPQAAVCIGIAELLVFCRQPKRDAAWASELLSK
ncbi:MAG: hypothetical protein U1E77_12795 [Inhella sp.]